MECVDDFGGGERKEMLSREQSDKRRRSPPWLNGQRKKPRMVPPNGVKSGGRKSFRLARFC